MSISPDKNEDTHIYLYAKGWYKRTNVVDDICKIIANRCSLETISIANAKTVLLEVVFTEISRSGNPQNKFIQFCSKISTPSENNDETFFRAVIGILSTAKAKDLNLGEADYTILPKRSNED